MLLSDVGLLQTDLGGACRAVPIETGARGGEPGAAPADQRPAADRAKRLLISSIDRLILVGLYRLLPDVRGALTIVKPDTVIRWHRAGFRAYWRRKSRTRGGRPKVPPTALEAASPWARLLRLRRTRLLSHPGQVHPSLVHEFGSQISQFRVTRFQHHVQQPLRQITFALRAQPHLLQTVRDGARSA